MTPLTVAKKQIVLTEKQVVELIKAGQGSKYLSAYAKEIGISFGYLNDIYQLRRSPGPKILDYFGIQKTRRVIVEYRK